MGAVTEDWTRAADEVTARMAELRMSRQRLADLAGVDRKTVGNFLDHGKIPQPALRGGYERALGWAYGSLTRLAGGGKPRLADVEEPPAAGSLEQAIDEDPRLLPEARAHLRNQLELLLRLQAAAPPGFVQQQERRREDAAAEAGGVHVPTAEEANVRDQATLTELTEQAPPPAPVKKLQRSTKKR